MLGRSNDTEAGGFNLQRNRQRKNSEKPYRIAKPLVSSVMVAAEFIAGLGSLLGQPRVWIERALVVFVAAAPCALASAISVTVVAVIGAASKLGVLVKGGAALEALGRTREM